MFPNPLSSTCLRNISLKYPDPNLCPNISDSSSCEIGFFLAHGAGQRLAQPLLPHCRQIDDHLELVITADGQVTHKLQVAGCALFFNCLAQEQCRNRKSQQRHISAVFLHSRLRSSAHPEARHPPEISACGDAAK